LVYKRLNSSKRKREENVVKEGPKSQLPTREVGLATSEEELLRWSSSRAENEGNRHVHREKGVTGR